MFKKNKLHNKIISVLKDRFSNWEEKSFYITSLIEKEEFGEEVFLQIIETYHESKIRKNAASVVGYTKLTHFVPRLIDRILVDNDWTVRFALSRSSAKLMGEKAIDLLMEKYNIHLQSINHPQAIYKLKKAFCESLGSMGLDKAIPILLSMLEHELRNNQSYTNELLVQIVYSLGEIGNEDVLEELKRYKIGNIIRTKNLLNSTDHALEKIAKKLGYSSFKKYQEDRIKTK
ncbi:MAG: HEAT repeat domain-containing protein [Candidatus Heimdallarchaeota archaeon]|nr:HEAT repeat domain-containing protein [Candidatus Heimdallarchaeota archaeon]